MKLLVSLILSFLFITPLYSQYNYPKKIVENDTNYYIFTEEQAKDVIRMKHIIDLYETMDVDNTQLEKNYLLIIDDKNKIISELEYKNSELINVNILNEDIISKLNERLSIKDNIINNQNQIIFEKDKIIKGKEKDLKKEKIKKNIGFISSGVAIVTVIILFIIGG